MPGQLRMADEPDYLSLQAHYERKLREYGDNHRGVDWPNKADAEKRYDVMLDLVGDPAMPASLLDIGCGLAHLYDRIVEKQWDRILFYEGLDISPAFITACRRKYPQIRFHEADILAPGSGLAPARQYDYAILNGVFTEKLAMSHAEMSNFFQKMLMAAFEFARKGVAFNVMSKHVDWERSDLFHLPFDEMAGFVTRNVTRNFVIRNDYGLFEYTVYLYR
jgi:SAM-dependent methyltransferase